jgi:ABC-type amino acid transport system permease subunit
MTNRPLRLGRRKVRPLVGEPFAAEDIQISRDADIEPRSKARVTVIIAVALIAFYGAYMAHEWRAGHSFDRIGQFLETAIVAFIGWSIGRASGRGRSNPRMGI